MVAVVSRYSCVQLFTTHGQWPATLLCSWDFPSKNTGVGYHVLLKGVFLTHISYVSRIAGGFFF